MVRVKYKQGLTVTNLFISDAHCQHSAILLIDDSFEIDIFFKPWC